MSRSYKKNPFVTDHKRGITKQKKSMANRIVRHRIKDANDEDMPARLQHKKMTESWDICDYKWRMTRPQAIEWYNDDSQYKSAKFKKRYPTLEAWLKYYDKCHRRK